MMRTRVIKMLSWIMALCLLAGLLPATARADDPALQLYIGSNTQVTLPDDMSPYTYGGDEGGAGTQAETLPADGYTWYLQYDESDGYTLTLNGATITTAYGPGSSKCGIYATGDLNLVLVGDSVVGGSALDIGPTSSPASSTGVSVIGGALNISGSGTLAATGGTVDSSMGCESGGVFASGDITVSGGTVTAKSSAVTGGGGSKRYGVYGQGNLNISDGTLTAESDAVTGTMGSNSRGVFINTNINISGGTVTAESASVTESTGNSYGMFAAAGSINITGGTVTAKSTSTTGTAGAMNKAPVLTGYTGHIATASVNADGSGPVTYVSADISTYKYINIQPPPAINYDVWVGSTRVTSANKDDVLGAADGDGATVTYTPAVGTSGLEGHVPQTLTLNGATIDTAFTDTDGNKYGIYAEDALNLVLTGSNTIGGAGFNTTENNDYSYGVYVYGSCNISGSGTLATTGGTVTGVSSQSLGLYVRGNFNVSGSVTLYATGGDATNASAHSYGVFVGSASTVTISGTLTATGSASFYSSGVWVSGADLTIVGGTVTATGGEGTASSYGIYTKSITITDSAVTATGGTSNESYGIYAVNSITITGSTVTAKSTAEVGIVLAMNRTPDLSGYTNVSVTASVNADGSDPVEYTAGGSVSAYKYIKIQPKSATPTADTPSVAKTAATQASVSFTLTNVPAYVSGQTWRIYTSADGDTQSDGVSASNTGNTLTLTHGTDLPAEAYYVSVTETGKGESDRLELTVTACSPPPPSSGGGGSPPAPNYRADVNAGAGGSTTLPVTVDKNSGTASVDTGPGTLGAEGTVVTMPPVSGVSAYAIGIPVPDLSTESRQGSLTVNTGAGSLTVPSNMLTGVQGATGSKAQISIGEGDKDSLPAEVKETIGDRPLLSLTLSIDGNQTDWSNPNAPVTVSIPYTPTASELANPESIVVWYIDGSGNVVTIPSGRYNAATGTVTFSTTHFSDYAVAYNRVNFNDVSVGAWYNKAVSFIAARDITSGTGDGSTYSPEAELTRGEFIVLMMRAYGIAPDENPTDNFADSGNTYYTDYLAAAKRLGISAGVGNNMYTPDNQITRQEMFTLLYNALKVIGRLPNGASGKTVFDFSDSAQISSWAQEAMTLLVKTGTVGGSNGKLTPTGTATRAEMAQVLYNLLGK